LTTSKPPAGLRDAPWFKEHPLNLETITERTSIFRGSVADAVRWFPQNVNVAAVLNLAAIHARSVSVEVVADPNSTRNVHELYVRVRGDVTASVERSVTTESKDQPLRVPQSARTVAALVEFGGGWKLTSVISCRVLRRHHACFEQDEGAIIVSTFPRAQENDVVR
jgi:predicted dinucleotide-utilizing enzyme